MVDHRSLGFRLEQLNTFSQGLLDAETEEEVAWTIVKEAISQLGFEDCVIYLLNPESGDLKQVAAHGPKNPVAQNLLNPISIPVGKGIVGAAAQTKEVQLVEDVLEDERYILDDQQRRSELAIPLL